jgi:hypothetical protein
MPSNRRNRRRQKVAKSAPRIRLDDLRILVGGGVDDFLVLSDVLHLRGCNRALSEQYRPSAAPALWRRIRPAISEFARVAVCMRAAGAAFFEGLYSGSARVAFYLAIGKAACAADNVDLIRWYYASPMGGDDHGLFGPRKCFVEACRSGRTRVAAWMATHFISLNSDCLRHTDVLSIACGAGNVAMAEWLIRFGYEPNEREYGYCLLDRAREYDDVAVAAWVLATFPLAISSCVLCAMILDNCALAPHCVRLLVDHFDLSWADVRETYPLLLQRLEPASGWHRLIDNAACQSVYEWLVRRYGADYSREASGLDGAEAMRLPWVHP